MTTKTTPKRSIKVPHKWQRPKDKPKRPLSAYNLFYKDVSQQLTGGGVPHLIKSSGKSCLAQVIAPKWKALDSESRGLYEDRAMEERKKYFTEVARWKQSTTTSPQEKEDKTPICHKATKSLCCLSRTYQDVPHEEISHMEDTIYDAEKEDKPPIFCEATKSLCGLSMAYQDVLQRQILQTIENICSALFKYADVCESQRKLEPLPIGCSQMDDTTISVISQLFDEDCFGDKKDEPLDCQGMGDSMVEGTNEMHVLYNEDTNHNCNTQYSPLMKRMIASFDALGVDEEIYEFMSTMEWDKLC